MASTVYRLAAGTLTAFIIAVRYWFVVGDEETLAQLASLSLRFFSFFTILTNVLAAAALLAPVLAPGSAIGKFLARPSVRTAITGYIIMVGAVYHLLLLGVSREQGWPLTFELMLHYLTPPLFVLDWLLFVDKRDLGWRVGVTALGFPIAYIAWTLVHGALSGWYPYPFVDVPELGYARVPANIAGLIVIFLVLELALVALGRLLARVEATWLRS